MDCAVCLSFWTTGLTDAIIGWRFGTTVLWPLSGFATLGLTWFVYELLGTIDHSRIKEEPDLLALDEALIELARVDERKAQVVEMRFFGGLTEKEAAIALGVAPETARRDWRLAKSWLLRKLSEKPRC